MISDDELHDGMMFILQLKNSAGVEFQWMETLKDQVARRWYDIYRSSDWDALKAEAAGVFRHPVTETQRDDFLKKASRCISINTSVVKVEDLRGNAMAEQSKGSS
jgi:hypothetical protein